MELEERIVLGVEAMSPAHRIRKHPIPAVGVAALTGFAVAFWFPRVRPVVTQIAKDFAPEISAAGKVGAGIIMQMFSEKMNTR